MERFESKSNYNHEPAMRISPLVQVAAGEERAHNEHGRLGLRRILIRVGILCLLLFPVGANLMLWVGLVAAVAHHVAWAIRVG